MYSRTKGKYDSLCFETTTHTLKLYEIKELFKTGKVIFLRPEIQTMKKLPKQLTTTNTVSINSTPSAINAKKESEEKRKRKQIFQNIPCVRISCILDNLQVGQLVINYQLRVGKITALTDEKVIVDFGRNSKKYRIPLDFINQKLKIWGILYGKVYGSTERDLLLEKFDIIRKKIDSTNL